MRQRFDYSCWTESVLDLSRLGLRFPSHDTKADNETIQNGYESQTKTQKQAENWMSFDDVKAKWNEEYARIKPILNAKTEPTNNDLWALSKFMMLTVTSGVFFPPRRSEWIDLKLKPENKNTDNWIDKKAGEFVWNNYKTAKTYGQQRVPYPKEFKTILNKYLKRIGEQTYFIFDTSGQQINKPAFTQTLNRMYGKNISTSMLRHIYLSDLHKHTPPRLLFDNSFIFFKKFLVFDALPRDTAL